MCFGLESAWLPALIGGGLSIAGTAMQQKDQRRQQEDIANARNEELRRNMVKNDALAEEGRDTFQKRLADASQDAMAADQAKAEKTRSGEIEQAQAPPPESKAGEEGAQLTGSASTVVKSDLAARMKEALSKGTEQAKALGKLGSYGDSWLNQGFMDTQAGRDIGVTTNKAAGNSALLPYMQDFAEHKVSRPASPIGAILQGFGNMLGSYGGTGGGLARKSYTTPFIGGS